jgi:hypothetical protein
MQPVLELIRLEETDAGTFGVLKVNKQVFCVTLEPGDLENAENRSSIPAQQYTCRRVSSPAFGKTYQVLGVPGRSDILFHPGNTIADTAGCILLAEHFGKLAGDRAVLNSGNTFRQFVFWLEKYPFLHLTVREVY